MLKCIHQTYGKSLLESATLNNICVMSFGIKYSIKYKYYNFNSRKSYQKGNNEQFLHLSKQLAVINME